MQRMPCQSADPASYFVPACRSYNLFRHRADVMHFLHPEAWTRIKLPEGGRKASALWTISKHYGIPPLANGGVFVAMGRPISKGLWINCRPMALQPGRGLSIVHEDE